MNRTLRSKCYHCMYTMSRIEQRPRKRRAEAMALSDSDEDNGSSAAGPGVPHRGQPAARADDFIPMGDGDGAMDIATCTYEPFPEDEWWTTAEGGGGRGDEDYCYFCQVYSGPDEKNEYRDKMDNMMRTLCTRMDMQVLCQYVARYHRDQVQKYDEEDKQCSAAMIYRHFTDHEIIPQLLQADFLRTTKRYHHQFKKTAVRKDLQGRELPPDPEHVKNHLRVMQAASVLCGKLSKGSDNN